MARKECPERRRSGIYLMAGSALDRRAYRQLLDATFQIPVQAESDFSPVNVWAAVRSRPELLVGIQF